MCVIVIIGATTKGETNFYRDIAQESYLPNMLLKGCLVKLKYSSQGSIQTDENYIPFLTPCVIFRSDIFAKFLLQVLQKHQAKNLSPQHAFKRVSCQVNYIFSKVP